jgi:choline/glycine/proline betaine transport protein
MKRNPFLIGCEWTGVFTPITIIIIIALTLMFKQGAEEAFTATQNFVANKGVVFILSVNIFLIFMIYLAFSKFGQLRIGAKR